MQLSLLCVALWPLPYVTQGGTIKTALLTVRVRVAKYFANI